MPIVFFPTTYKITPNIILVFGAILPNVLDCAKITHKYFTHSKLYNKIKQALIINTVATRHDSTSSGGGETQKRLQPLNGEALNEVKQRSEKRRSHSNSVARTAKPSKKLNAKHRNGFSHSNSAARNGEATETPKAK